MLEGSLVALAVLAVVIVIFVARQSCLEKEHGDEEDEPAGSQPYVREEEETVAAFYEPYAGFMAETPADILALVAVLSSETGLPEHSEAYPVDEPTLARAAHAFIMACNRSFGVTISLDSSDATQLDQLANAHLIDPVIRPFFGSTSVREELTEGEGEEYARATEAIRILREPLLYYCMGAFWGEWLCRHRRAVWCLQAPLRPVQSFPDMITAGHMVCMHPFSQVVKKMSDPEGDQLAFKVSAGIAWRYLPPFPLLASLADADYATYSLLPQEAHEAQALAEQGDSVAAIALLEKALEHSPENVCLYSVAIQVAFQGEEWQRVEDWSLAALRLCPEHPVLSHNLAVLYSWQEDLLAKAVGLLESALAQAPNYGRAHLTLASCYAQTGEMGKANEHFDWVKEHDQELAPEAELILADLQNGDGE